MNIFIIFLNFIFFYFIIFINKNKIIKLIIKLNIFFLIFFFLTKNIILFYLIFELSIIPIIFILSFWGYQIERLQAVTYLFFYAILFSTPSFFFFLKINNFFLNLNLISNYKTFNFFFFFVKIIILIKIPFFFFKRWLKKEKLEAQN